MSEILVDNSTQLIDLLASNRVLPGDVINLMPGTYAGDWVIPVGISGLDGKPVIIRPKIIGTVLIDGSWQVNGNYVEIYDLDFTDSRPDRSLLTPGITISGLGHGLFGCIVSDLHSSGVSWFGSGIGEVSENIFLNNGYLEADQSKHGHALYTHNNAGGARKIARNIFFDQMGDYTIHIYSGGANYLKDYTCEENIVCGDPVHTGGGLGLINYLYQRNVQYGLYCQQGRYGYTHQNQNGQILDNVFIGLQLYTVNQNCNLPWLNLVESGNEVYGGEPSSRNGYTVFSQPQTWVRAIPFSKSRRWAAALAIFNRDGAEVVPVDFSFLRPGIYNLRNAQNPVETLRITSRGSVMEIPTQWTSAARIGDVQPATSWPFFGGLLVENTFATYSLSLTGTFSEYTMMGKHWMPG